MSNCNEAPPVVLSGKMRITFVLPTVAMSGGIRVVSIYAKLLSAKGHEVVLVSPPPAVPSLRRKAGALLKGRGWPKTPDTPRSHLDGGKLDHRVLDKWRPVMDSDVPDADVIIATWWETAEWVSRLGNNK